MKKLDLGKKKDLIKYIMDTDNKNLKIYNISYREFFVCLDYCFIAIYPFSYSFINYYNDKKIRCNHQHHIDFHEGKIDYDPCLIYEKISTHKIHTENEDDVNYSDIKNYENNKIEYVNYYMNRLRRLKLETI
ncbi:hypothetical protein M0Q50_09555 [bacterium]|jgi:hypothetical protein|nr:hypothetical protein [bacterium]